MTVEAALCSKSQLLDHFSGGFQPFEEPRKV